MDIGKLRHRLTLQKYTATRDELGAEVKTWVDFATIWGQVKAVNGREEFTTEQLKSLATNIVYIRYIEGLQPDMRILYKDRVLNITSIQEDGIRQITKLLVTEVVENGPKD